MDRNLFNKVALIPDKPYSWSYEYIVLNRIFYDIKLYELHSSIFVVYSNDREIFGEIMPFKFELEGNDITIAFSILESLNRTCSYLTVQHVPASLLDFYRKAGVYIREAGTEYIYNRHDLISLRGNRYKKKRSGYNMFIKRYSCCFRGYRKEDLEGIRDLIDRWRFSRLDKKKDFIYSELLNDYTEMLLESLYNQNDLKLMTGIIEYNGYIAGFTAGYPLSDKEFCIMFEVCDYRFKGIAQYLFIEFCKSLDGYKFINVMDDCGLENLKEVKMSYHPCILRKLYTVGKAVK